MASHPAHALGVTDGFHDVSGRWHPPSPATLDAILAAMGGEGGRPPPGALPLFVRQGERAAVAQPRLQTEDGGLVDLDGTLPPDLPLGYHRLLGPDAERRVVVAPPRCHLPPELAGWGFAVQLYALHSARSQGIGDLADLGELNRWASDLGAAFLLLSPLHAALPGLPQEPSPYYPSSRLHRNPLHLRVEGGARPPAGELVDRDAAWTWKMAALEAEWERVRAGIGPELEAYAAQVPALLSYGRFCALSEVHGRSWREWPEELRDPGSAAVERFGEERRDRVLFAAWLQLKLDRQLAAAAAPAGLVSDLAVGVRPDGFDAWLWQDVLADGVTVGAPPDPFNTAGQDWGLPPFNPWRLAERGFEPWRQTVRAALRSAAGVRIDHVMGLFRLYWIPRGAGPEEGAYVRYPARELLDVLALESARAGAFVVGEDLGTVEDEVRRELGERAVLSYRLLWFEPGRPEDFPAQSLAALTTHDLPTLLGVWSGSDPLPEVRARLGLPEGASDQEVLEGAARQLARAASRLKAMTLEDLAGVRERPNLPGTLAPENWSRRLPLTIEELRAGAAAERLAAILGGRA